MLRHLSNMEYVYYNKNSEKTLLVLHGTGGNEYDMIPLANIIDSKANILGIRGNINENGLFRFFLRFDIGKYDIDSYLKETENLRNEILRISLKEKFNLEKTTIIGFSNGANIALGLIQEYPKFLKKYALLNPDYINKEKEFKNLENNRIFMTSSKNDPYVKYSNIINLENELISKNANLLSILVSEHKIDANTVEQLKKWYEGE